MPINRRSSGRFSIITRLFTLTLKSDIVDPLLRLLSPRARRETVLEAGNPGRIVDVFTGTGSMVLRFARRFPNADLITVDRDPKALRLVEDRITAAGLREIITVNSNADSIPLEDCAADLVNISFGLHENDRAARKAILTESLRLLKPGGTLLVTDYRETGGSILSILMNAYLRLFEPAWVGELFHGGLACEIEDAGFETTKRRYDIPMTQLIRARRP